MHNSQTLKLRVYLPENLSESVPLFLFPSGRIPFPPAISLPTLPTRRLYIPMFWILLKESLKFWVFTQKILCALARTVRTLIRETNIKCASTARASVESVGVLRFCFAKSRTHALKLSARILISGFSYEWSFRARASKVFFAKTLRTSWL